MIYKFQFNTESEKEEIINKNKDKFIIEINYLKDGNFIFFSNENTLEIKIDILEAEKEKLLEITKEQDKLLVDNTYKISMLEMNLGGM